MTHTSWNSRAYVTGGPLSNARCLKLIPQPATHTVTMTRVAKMNHKRIHHSACASQNRYVVVSGTRQPLLDSSSVERFDTLTETWEVLPRLKVGRFRHSSCAVNSQIYVFCGMDRNSNQVNSIEVLSTRHLSDGW